MVSVLHNDGNGAFPARVDYPLAFGASLVSALDRNGDGRADVFTAGPAGASLLLNPGNGTFPTRVDYPGSAGASTLVELNGDGRLDLATVLDEVAIRVQLGEAGGRLDAKVAYPAGAAQRLLDRSRCLDQAFDRPAAQRLLYVCRVPFPGSAGFRQSVDLGKTGR